MVNKINELAKALPQKATLLTISKDLHESLTKSFYPKEHIVLAPSAPSGITKIHTENGVLNIKVVDEPNVLLVT